MSVACPYSWFFATEADYHYWGPEYATLKEAEEELQDNAEVWNGVRLYVRYERDHDEHGEPWSVFLRVYEWDEYGELEFDRLIAVENIARRRLRWLVTLVLFLGILLIACCSRSLCQWFQ